VEFVAMLLPRSRQRPESPPRLLATLAVCGTTTVIFVACCLLGDVLLCPHFKVHTTGAIVVTGASSGIGEHAASTLAATTSFTVYAGVRNMDDAVRLEASHPGLRTVFLDVTSHDSIAAAVQHVVDENPDVPLVGLVNNAGVQADRPIELQESAADRFNFDVNVFGLLDVTRAFLPALRKTGSGARIVNVGSLAGVVASAGSATYSATKFAVEGITDALRREVQPFGVAVSLLEPGYVRSEMGLKLHGSRSSLYGVTASDYELYRKVFDGFFEEDRLASLPQNAAPPATTTTPAIVDAITSPTPQTRYPVASADGLPAWFIVLAHRLLPDRIMDVLA